MRPNAWAGLAGLGVILLTACGSRTEIEDRAPAATSTTTTPPTGGRPPGAPPGPTLVPPSSSEPPSPKPPPTGIVSYRASEWPTNLPRFAIYKRDDALNTCTQIVLGLHSGSSDLAIATPDRWSVERVLFTNRASECATSTASFAGSGAVSGIGAITFFSSGANVPCKANAHATVKFADGTPPQRFDVDGVTVEGACP